MVNKLSLMGRYRKVVLRNKRSGSACPIALHHPQQAVGALTSYGSVVILGGLSLVNSLHAYTFASLKRKKLISTTPLNDALNALILALNASAAAFVLLFTKKFKILS